MHSGSTTSPMFRNVQYFSANSTRQFVCTLCISKKRITVDWWFCRLRILKNAFTPNDVCTRTINHFFFRKKKKEPYLDLFGFHEHNSDESFISVTLFSYYKIHMILTYLIRLVQGLTNLPICNISLVFRFLPYSFSPYLFIYVDVMTWVSSLVLVLSLSSSLSQ